MSKVRVRITVSADGYVAGPNQSVENPLGEGGGSLHDWAFALKAVREGPDLGLEQVRAVEAPGVTHLKYRVLK
jgi:hypothetical protein